MFERIFSINGRIIGPNEPCFVIAEAGVSHFGSLKNALALVDMAAKAGADAVKFQIFKTEKLISSKSRDWIQRMRPKELSLPVFREIRNYCKDKGIIFFATAHDLDSLESLAELEQPVYKIGSGEVGNPAFFQAVASLGKPVIFSTGMYSRADLEKSLETLSQSGCNRVAVLHCVTQYPTDPKNVNLRRIQAIREIFPGPVGYSDHSAFHEIAAASVLLGAEIIEKHITLEKDIPNAQDWKVACDPKEFVRFVSSIRRLQQALGTGAIDAGLEETEASVWARKSIVAAHDIPAGHILSATDITCKRPGTGIRPDRIMDVIGKRAKKDIIADTSLSSDCLE